MKTIRLITLLTLCIPSISYASYTDGFCALMMFLYLLPAYFIGVIITVISVSLKKYKNKSVLYGYLTIWGCIALVASSLCLHELLFGLAFNLFALLPILLPPIIQYKVMNKKEGHVGLDEV